ncbi:MAG: family 10 glycosylhydrolase [Chryseolinea sp.]
MPKTITYFLFCLLILACSTSNHKVVVENGPTVWPDSIEWWKANNLRVIQTNLPAYEGSLNTDSLLQDLNRFSANVLIINGGGIMAFYATKLEYQYTNPYMNPQMLNDVVAKCHAAGIKVIVRFDFSRAHKSIFEKHPDWFYISPDGERIINDDMYVVSINAPYEQEQMFNIVGEVINTFPVDGIFINMPGYQTRNSYVGKYHGVDQNPYDKKRFFDYSHGLKLPVKEDFNDPVFQKYLAFKQYTAEDLMKRLHHLIKSRSAQIAICTYSDKYVDIIRHESQSNSLPYWPYNASDNVNSTRTSFPDHIVSNASIQQISFQSRYNAIEPEEVCIRLYENIANGSGLDISLMGDFRDYEDERNYDIVSEVYAHHKKFEKYYGRYKTTAEVAVIAPGSWPSGESAQEYRGIQLMLKEAHIQYDLIEDSQVGDLEERMRRYRIVVLPEIVRPDSMAVEVLSNLVAQGTNLIATNHSFVNNPAAMRRLFGATVVNGDHDGGGFYITPGNGKFFGRLSKQKLVSWKFNLSLYDFIDADTLLNIYTPGRPGPPEIIGGHKRTKYYALGIKDHGKSKAAFFTGNVGRLYYLSGYEQYKNIFLDVLDNLSPDISKQVVTNAPARVEIIVQRFVKNEPANLKRSIPEDLILHFVNLTGFSGNTYFDPLTVRDISVDFRLIFNRTKFSLWLVRMLSNSHTRMEL